VADFEFQFPEDCSFPNLPVLVSKDLFCFPRQGRTIVGGPEILAAVRRGATVGKLHYAYFIPFKKMNKDDDIYVKPYYESIKRLQLERRKHAKDSMENYILKLILNSIYGMTASGINPKTRFNTITNETDEGLYESKLSCPFTASYTTSFIRAVIAEMLFALEKNKSLVLSVTTDG